MRGPVGAGRTAAGRPARSRARVRPSVARASAARPALAALLALAVLGLPAPAAAQQGEPADSVRERVRERLRRLAEFPRLDPADTIPGDSLAPDSLLFGPDTLPRNVEYRPTGGGDAAADTILELLLSLPGYTATRYEGVSAVWSAREGRLVLIGDTAELARVERRGIAITADSAIVYDEEAGRVRSVGSAVFYPEDGDPVTSRVIVYDLEAERGSALGARTRYRQGAEWIVTGDLTSVTDEVIHGHDARFTSCDLEEPHYHFRTDELKVVADRILVARPVTLYFADVPVGWLPFMAQSLERGRASGLLTPRFSINDVVRVNRGNRRRISNLGYYWAMSDYTDAWVAFDWFSGQYTSLTGTLRWHWLRQFLRGQASYRHYWREEGGREMAVNANTSWEATERTDVRASVRYASSTSFVRRNSFDPREVTQSVDSEGGVQHRFDWGTLSLSANRREFLSDDRIEATLPSLNLSLRPITFFETAPGEGRWYNNVTWSGSGRLRRNTFDRDQSRDTVFGFSLADRRDLDVAVSSSLNLGYLSWSQSLSYQQGTTVGVPESFFLSPFPDGLELGEEGRDVSEARIGWSSSLSYQQGLIGTTTLTPRVSVSGQMLRSDTSLVASDFVQGPIRIDFGANLRTDLFGFYRGFGPFERLRHKVSPSLSWSYSPAVEPTALQELVFGAREGRTRNTLTLSFNQTLEARLEEEEAQEALEDAPPGEVPLRADEEPAPGAVEPAANVPEPGQRDAPPGERDAQAGEGDAAAGEGDAAAGEGDAPPGEPGGATRGQAPTGRPITLFALRTSVLSYDFVEADSAGDFLAGFTTTRLRNQVSSDFLRGLSLSFEHDLFEDSVAEGRLVERSFSPHLSQLNLSFSLTSSSAVFRWLDFLYEEDEAQAAAPPAQNPAGRPEGMDESQVIPGDPQDPGPQYSPELPSRIGGWNLSVSYSLQRPREGRGRRTGFGRETSQMLLTNLAFSPTDKWDLSWRTSYDLELGRFNDHMVRLTRDLHRWQANFDFLQTATGNWSFRFFVQLMDNQDLKLDYEQRSVEGQRF